MAVGETRVEEPLQHWRMTRVEEQLERWMGTEGDPECLPYLQCSEAWSHSAWQMEEEMRCEWVVGQGVPQGEEEDQQQRQRPLQPFSPSLSIVCDDFALLPSPL